MLHVGSIHFERKWERENQQDQTRKKERLEARLNCKKEGMKGEKWRPKYLFYPYTPIFLHTYVQDSNQMEEGCYDLTDVERMVSRVRHGVGGPLWSESVWEIDRQMPHGSALLGLSLVWGSRPHPPMGPRQCSPRDCWSSERKAWEWLFEEMSTSPVALGVCSYLFKGYSIWWVVYLDEKYDLHLCLMATTLISEPS